MPTLDTKQLWESVLVEIELSMSRATFSTWFKDTGIVKHEEGIIYLGVPSEFVRQWLAEKYHRQILKYLRERIPGVRGVEYTISKGVSRPREEAKPVQEITGVAHELPLNDYYINKEDNLNPRYTFESFVMGPFNELAYAASQAVVKNPGISYNPLFFYGDTGHGKTHLIQAVGNAIKHNTPSKKVYYVTSERFLIDYVSAIQNNKVDGFKEKYRAYDVLIMDDVQFLANKEKSQEELFHLFNALYDNNKQLILSSDKHPNHLTGIESRLASRFSVGMTIEIPAPDEASRIAILRLKAEKSPFPLSENLLRFIAEEVNGNVRELEGALNAVICQAQLLKREPSLGETQTLIKDSARPKKTASVKEVIKTISSFYDIEEESIYEKTRRKEVVRPRQIIMYVLREDFGISYPTIGQKLGGRDHTTVIHSCEKIKEEIKRDTELTQEIDRIRTLLK